MDATRYAGYRQAVLEGFAAYRQRHFAGREALFETGSHGEVVFRLQSAHLNFFDPAFYHAVTCRPANLCSLSNPAVLAISVFGTLAQREDLALLADVPCDDGQPILAGAVEAQSLALDLQPGAPFLAERRPGAADAWLQGESICLAIRSRFMERGLAPCPQPERGHCDGDYAEHAQGGRCWHSEQGVRYWDYLPGALGWSKRRTYRPCPLRRPFDLARTTLAAAGQEAPAGARRGVLLVYDARNPAFAPGSRASRLFLDLQAGLKPPLTLRRTTWQAIAAAMARSPWYGDLLEYLKVKYGVEGE